LLANTTASPTAHSLTIPFTKTTPLQPQQFTKVTQVTQFIIQAIIQAIIPPPAVIIAKLTQQMAAKFTHVRLPLIIPLAKSLVGSHVIPLVKSLVGSHVIPLVKSLVKELVPQPGLVVFAGFLLIKAVLVVRGVLVIALAQLLVVGCELVLVVKTEYFLVLDSQLPIRILSNQYIFITTLLNYLKSVAIILPN